MRSKEWLLFQVVSSIWKDIIRDSDSDHLKICNGELNISTVHHIYYSINIIIFMVYGISSKYCALYIISVSEIVMTQISVKDCFSCCHMSSVGNSLKFIQKGDEGRVAGQVNNINNNLEGLWRMGMKRRLVLKIKRRQMKLMALIILKRAWIIWHTLEILIARRVESEHQVSYIMKL